MVRNHSFNGLELKCKSPMGGYRVDFIYREKKIFVELDGGQYNILENKEYDKERSLYLENKGYQIIRFWNKDLDNNIAGVYDVLKLSCGI
jgi:very-short-patch-repair endonuclease